MNVSISLFLPLVVGILPAVGRSDNPGVPVNSNVVGHNLLAPPLVEIEITDLPKS